MASASLKTTVSTALTTKTGLTAVSGLATALICGFTGAMPVGTAVLTGITSLLHLFQRAGTEENAASSSAAP